MQRSRNISHLSCWQPLALIIVLFLAIASAANSPPAQARERPARHAAASPQSGGQMYYDNLTVREGDVYEGDVTVAAGNVLVEDGGLIEGNLVVWSGNVVIDLGGEVEGDVSTLSGNVTIAGEVGGNVAAVSGNIELRDTATVAGDVSVIGGDILRAPGAEIEGDVIEGADIRIPRPFSGWRWRAALPEAPSALAVRDGPSFWGWLGWLIFRMVLAVIFTAIVVVLVSVLYNLRPDLIRPLTPLVRERTAYTFIVGLIVNLVLLVLTSALFFTICLAILGLAPGLVLVVLNLIGWTLASQMIGDRLAANVQTPMQPTARVAIGAIVATGVVMVLWALGGCFRPAAYLLWLLTSSFGVGAAIVHWLKLDRTALTPPPGGEPEPSGPSSDPARAGAPVEPSGPPPVEADLGAPEKPTVSDTPVSSTTPPSSSYEADFTVIKGIGATFDRRLKAAGVRTFSQLAALTPEQVAEIIGWSPQRVIEDDLLGQARRLASDRMES